MLWLLRVLLMPASLLCLMVLLMSSPRTDLSTYPQLPQRWAVGVVLAVRKEYLGEWSLVQHDEVGRGLAGNLTLQSGMVLRVVGVYGPSGASLPGFDSVAERVADERRLVSWVQSQLDLYSARGWHPIVVGDLNSVGAPSLDCWGTSHVLRPSSLVPAMESVGMVDVFRVRHPTLRAFTFYTRGDSASRLDYTSLRVVLSFPCFPRLMHRYCLWGKQQKSPSKGLADFLDWATDNWQLWDWRWIPWSHSTHAAFGSSFVCCTVKPWETHWIWDTDAPKSPMHPFHRSGEQCLHSGQDVPGLWTPG